jgi:phage tail-like protein
MATRNDPLRNFRFKIEIDGITQAGFSEAMLAESTLDVIDYRVGTDPTHVQKLNGLRKNGNITLKWGMVVGASALDLFKWFNDVGNGQIRTLRKKVTIHVFNEAGEAAARFVVSEAWPMKYDPPDLNAKGNDVTIELLELANEGVERVA